MSGLSTWQKYPDALHVISLGAGRQSSVMYLMALAGEIEPRPQYAIFADTGNEPDHVYRQLHYLMDCCIAAGNPIPIHVVRNGDIYEDTMAALNGGNPWQAQNSARWLGPPAFSEGGGPIKRKCTRHYKIQPKEDEIRRLLKLTGKGHVVDWRGHTIDEVERAKQDKRQYYIVRWPLLEARMSDNDCARWQEKNGHPEFLWSACKICPFRLRQRDTARQLAAMYPGEWQGEIIPLDERIRDLSAFGLDRRHYLNADYIPMQDFIEQEPEERPQMSLFDCDGGVCGL